MDYLLSLLKDWSEALSMAPFYNELYGPLGVLMNSILYPLGIPIIGV